MFRAGLADEVRRLASAGYTPLAPGLRAIGYREFFAEGGEGGISAGDVADVEALVARNSRRYAKRQLTYFASIASAEGPVRWLSASNDPATHIRAELAAWFGTPCNIDIRPQSR
jgi:tRNA dimethylallyltransferase